MKAIILAAGEGTRLRPLTNTTPKPLIKICGKSIIEHNLENIYDSVDEIIIIVKYMEEKFKETLGEEYKGTKISYRTQGDYKGTAGALKSVYYNDDVLILNGDSIFEKEDITALLKSQNYGVLVKQVSNPEIYGVFKLKQDGSIDTIVEKPQEFIGDLASLGAYKFSSDIFSMIEKVEISPRSEYEITDALNSFASSNTFSPITITGEFIDVGYCWDILTANSHFLNKLSKSDIKGTIEEGVTIKGNIILEEGAILKSGTYIEGNCYIGKNASIGPHTYLRGETVIGEGCKIGNAVEVKNSSFGDFTNAAHLSYIGDSVIGNHVNLGGGFSSANLRHDNKNIRVMVKDKLTDTGKRKLGVIIGDNVKTAVNTTTMPGRIIETGSFTSPGEVIK